MIPGREDGCNLYAYVHNNPMIYVDPYGLWGISLSDSWNRGKEFGGSFSRGFADDASFGATTYALGEDQTPTFNSKAAYYTGTACSLGTGLFYGSTWIKGAMYGGKLLNYGCRIAKTAITTTKTLKQTCTVVKTASCHVPVAQVAQKTLNVGASVAGKFPATSSISANLLRNKLIAEEISGGHAFAKHVIKKNEFPGFSRSQFEQHLRRILNNPSDAKALLRGRTGYWDQLSGTVIVRDPSHIDGGTAFRADLGKLFFDEILE